MFSIDTTENKDSLIHQFHWPITDTVSVIQSMSCLVSNSFNAEDKAEINNTAASSLNGTFELSAQDISLVSYNVSKIFSGPLSHSTVTLLWQVGVFILVDWNRLSLFATTINEFDNEAPSMLARDSSYSQGPANLTTQNLCCIR